jgi:transcriptional regulator with XRE-family HTH domain
MLVRRESLGLRREDVAARAGISYDYVRKLETMGDEANPSIEVARAIASALNSTVDLLFPVAG